MGDDQIELEPNEEEIAVAKKKFARASSRVPNRTVRNWPTMEDLVSWSVFEYLVGRPDLKNIKPLDIKGIVQKVYRRSPILTHQELYVSSPSFRGLFLPHDYKG